jgi:molybdopterin adenylyltransferase
MSSPKIGILTVSDRASQGIYEDLSGPAIEKVLKDFLLTPCTFQRAVVPDELPAIVESLRTFSLDGCALVCTTGSTGPAPRDIMPEAMETVCEKFLPGFGELMRAESLKSGVPTAILSRQSAGILEKTLIVNLPGKPASIRVCLEAIFPAIPYCIDLIGGAFLEGNPEVIAVFRPGK